MIQDLFIDSSFGDFVIDTDVKYITKNKLLLNIVNERIKTNNKDFRLNTDSGASLDRFVGLSLDSRLIKDMVTSIVSCLTIDGLLLPSNIEVVPMKLNEHEVYFRVIINTETGTVTASTLYNSGEIL